MTFPSHPRIEPRTFWEFYLQWNYEWVGLPVVPTLPLTAEGMATWLAFKGWL